MSYQENGVVVHVFRSIDGMNDFFNYISIANYFENFSKKQIKRCFVLDRSYIKENYTYSFRMKATPKENGVETLDAKPANCNR